MSENFLDKVWEQNPEYIRQFYDNQAKTEKLCNEVEYILSLELKKENIEFAQITSRAKSLKSFCEKISRKSYKKPFENITDFAGVRVVYLYSSDRQEIESIIEKEFKIVEKVDKVSPEDIDKFGYGALHYLVKIKKTHSGARYDELKNLICEIQVRTILQDAWAIVAHHLSYKQESDVPPNLRRKLNALSGLFETADDQFENIRIKRSEYQDQVQESITKGKDISFDEDMNLDNLDVYLRWKFPDRDKADIEITAGLLEELTKHGYKKLVDIDNIVDKTSKAVNAYEKKYPPWDEMGNEHTNYAAVGIIRAALKFADTNYLNNSFTNIEEIEEFINLVE
jgi:GTP pyrophosphokinase